MSEPVGWQRRIYTTEQGWGDWKEIVAPHTQKFGKPLGYTNLNYWEDEAGRSYAPGMARSGSVQVRAVYAANNVLEML